MRFIALPGVLAVALLTWTAPVGAQDDLRADVFFGGGGFIADEGIATFDVGATAWLAEPRATYQDVLDAPSHEVADIVDGLLYTNPRSAAPHALASSLLGSQLTVPFHLGRGGPGGWWIIDKPELHLGDDILVPDLAGGRRTRMPTCPKTAYTTLVPDWVCEILSPSTRGLDLEAKRPVYAREGVRHHRRISVTTTPPPPRHDGRSERDVSAHLEARTSCAAALLDVEDEARPVALSKGQARTGGRPNVVLAAVFDPRAQRRANEPSGTSEPDRGTDSVVRPDPSRVDGGPGDAAMQVDDFGPLAAPVVLHHPVQRHRPGEPGVDADVVSGTPSAVPRNSGLEHETARCLLPGRCHLCLCLYLRGQHSYARQRHPEDTSTPCHDPESGA